MDIEDCLDVRRKNVASVQKNLLPVSYLMCFGAKKVNANISL